MYVREGSTAATIVERIRAERSRAERSLVLLHGGSPVNAITRHYEFTPPTPKVVPQAIVDPVTVQVLRSRLQTIRPK